MLEEHCRKQTNIPCTLVHNCLKTDLLGCTLNPTLITFNGNSAGNCFMQTNNIADNVICLLKHIQCYGVSYRSSNSFESGIIYFYDEQYNMLMTIHIIECENPQPLTLSLSIFMFIFSLHSVQRMFLRKQKQVFNCRPIFLYETCSQTSICIICCLGHFTDFFFYQLLGLLIILIIKSVEHRP